MRGGHKKIINFDCTAFAVCGVAKAEDCTVTVSSPALIQVAIDSNPSGVVCLSGTFKQSVAFGRENNGHFKLFRIAEGTEWQNGHFSRITQ